MILTNLLIALALLLYARKIAAANKLAADLAVRKINWTIDQIIARPVIAYNNPGTCAIGSSARVMTHEEVNAVRAERRLAKKQAKAERVAKALDRATPAATAETRKPTRL